MVTLDHAPLGDRAVGIQQVAHRLRQRDAALLVFLARDRNWSSAEVPSVLKMSTLWCAAIARPDSLTIIGCAILRVLHTLAMRYTTSLAYSLSV